MINFKRLKDSFKEAASGIAKVFKTEQNFRIQIIIGLLVIALSFYLNISFYEFIAVLLVISAVIILELLNSVLERLLDVFKPRLHPDIKEVKEIMAGIVFIAAVAAVIIGLIIFIPRL